jgi:hypothetical protein
MTTTARKRRRRRTGRKRSRMGTTIKTTLVCDEARVLHSLVKTDHESTQTNPGCHKKLSWNGALLAPTALCLPRIRHIAGKSTTHEMRPLMISAHFTPRRSSATRVVLERMRPPRPLPHAAIPWARERWRSNQCARRGWAGMRVWSQSSAGLAGLERATVGW